MMKREALGLSRMQMWFCLRMIRHAVCEARHGGSSRSSSDACGVDAAAAVTWVVWMQQQQQQ
jgi:hypothetical protein